VTGGTTTPVLDVARLERDLPDYRARYQAAAPYPHIVIDDFLAPDEAAQCASEFPSGDEWISFVHVNERKYANQQPETWGPTLQRLLDQVQSQEFVDFVSKMTGIENLVADDTLEGAGLHQSLRGGFLNMHADFTVHPKKRHWRRRVNLLVYFNPGWQEEWGGALELWSKDMSHMEEKIPPTLGRAVLFNTDADSFHGHPEPMTCPEGVARQSLALYYFTEEEAPVVRSTEYRARPGEGLRAVPIFLDKTVLRNYDRLKRRMGISDDKAGRILRSIDRLRHRKNGNREPEL
jgi:hypothetical protein